MCEIAVPVNHYDVITFHWKSSANPWWNYTGNGRILRGSAAIRGGIKIFRGGIISGQVSGIAGGSEKSSAGVGGLVKIPLDCTVVKPTNDNNIVCGFICRNQDILSMKFLDTLLQMPK